MISCEPIELSAPTITLVRFAPMPQPFTLIPHPALPATALDGIAGQIERTPSALMLRFSLMGNLTRIRIPPRRPPGFADNLWRHTCCEAFLRREGHAPYHEFNFAPSGEWATYAFARTRERLPLDPTTTAALDPHVTVCHSEHQLDLDAIIRLDRLALDDGKVSLGLAAVVEDISGNLSYWALRHPLDKPDFHHPDAFALTLE